jgi:hypothetical protein
MISKEIRDQIPSLPQRQDSTTDQLRDLMAVANKLGMYDACDWIRDRLEKNTKEATNGIKKR